MARLQEQHHFVYPDQFDQRRTHGTFKSKTRTAAAVTGKRKPDRADAGDQTLDFSVKNRRWREKLIGSNNLAEPETHV